MTELTAAVQQQADHTVIHIGGYLSTEAEAIEAAFAESDAAHKVLLSFDEKCFINSTGLAILFDLILPRTEAGRQVRIVHPAEHFRKVFDIVGLSKDVKVSESEAQALQDW
mgnify:CR=1 FL=1|jgi:anti-anti-sigma factor